MITKVDSTNKDLYKKFFNNLNDPSAATDPTYLEQIFSSGFTDNKAFLPLDEELFVVNADTRGITVPTNFRVNGFVLGDHMAEMLFFIIDRYYDTQDLNDTEIEFLWRTANGQEGRTEAAFRSTSFYNLLEEAKSQADSSYEKDSNRDKLFFCWPLTNGAISASGQLNFSITFYKKISQAEYNTKLAAINTHYDELIAQFGESPSEEESAQIQELESLRAKDIRELQRSGSDLYRLNTLPAVLNISNGLTVDTEDANVENRENELEQLIRNRFSSGS